MCFYALNQSDRSSNLMLNINHQNKKFTLERAVDL